MSYNLIGCMEMCDDGLCPVWTNPCLGPDLVGCMELNGGILRPKLIGGIGLCPDDKTGCMELIDGKLRPVLIFDEYNSADELYGDCCFLCIECGVCWDPCERPQYIEVTFSDVIWCMPDRGCFQNSPPWGTDPNVRYTLEYVGGVWDSYGKCKWCYSGPSGFDISLFMYVFSGVKAIVVQYKCCWTGRCGDLGGNLMFSGTLNPFTCGDTNISNTLDSMVCNIAGIRCGYDGTVVINWNP